MTVPTRQEDSRRQFIEHQTERADLQPAILIIGSCRADAFAPAEVLICADTLSAEKAIRAWLEAHGIRAVG